MVEFLVDVWEREGMYGWDSRGYKMFKLVYTSSAVLNSWKALIYSLAEKIKRSKDQTQVCSCIVISNAKAILLFFCSLVND